MGTPTSTYPPPVAQACVAVDRDTKCVALGRDRRFTFDHVFGPDASQAQLYEECVSELMEACLEGYNATVLAYGPTGEDARVHCCWDGMAHHVKCVHCLQREPYSPPRAGVACAMNAASLP